MKDIIESVRDKAKEKKVTFMDCRFVEKDSTSIQIQDGKADKVSNGRSSGIGIRVIVDGAWGFASTNILTKEKVDESLDTAIKMAKASSGKIKEPAQVKQVKPIVDKVNASFEIDPRVVPLEEKMKKAVMLEELARNTEKEKIANTILGYSDGWQHIIVCNSFGSYVDSESIRSVVNVNVVAREGNLFQNAYESEAKTKGFELLKDLDPEKFSIKAAKRAIALLSAKKAPSGVFPVILHPTIIGLFTHEALGHNAEADGVMAGESILEGKMGQNVASKLISIVDDPTYEGSWGFYKYDSEATPAQRNMLIENGILKGYMHSLETAEKFNAFPTGNARAWDFDCRPIVRMSNTNILPGNDSYKDMIKSIDNGVMLTHGLGGYVNVERGQFTFTAAEGWLIKKGEIQEQIRDVNMSGILLETLQKIDGVSKEHGLETMTGYCGKSGQHMYVGAGGPYVRVKELLIGGQE